MRRLTVVVLAALLGVVVVAVGSAQAERMATVEVRVWQNVGDLEDIRISARPAGGSWRTLGTIPLPLDETTDSGTFAYGDIDLDVPLPGRAVPATVEVRVWQRVQNLSRVYISARPANGSWRTLGTIALPLDDGFSSSGTFQFGDIALDVPVLPSADVVVTTLAGSPRMWGDEDGTGGDARFSGWGGSAYGTAIAVDRMGNVIVADVFNHAIRRLSPNGVVTTIAGGSGSGREDGPPEVAKFSRPRGVAVDDEGNIYVADQSNHLIRKIAPNGTVSTVAGRRDGRGHADGPARTATFDEPRGLAVDGSGNVYVIEERTIRLLSPKGEVSTFASPYPDDEPKVLMRLSGLLDIEVDGDGNVYAIDIEDGGQGEIAVVQRISPSGRLDTLYRSKPPTLGGTLARPKGLAVTHSGTVYVSNTGRNQILRLTDEGEWKGVAGTGADGSADGSGWTATFSLPTSLAASPDGHLAVVDQDGSVIRRIAGSRGGRPQGAVPLAEMPELPRVEGMRVSLIADEFAFRPHSLALDGEGNVIAVGASRRAVWRVSPIGEVVLLAGGKESGLRDGRGDEAQFRSPEGVVVDAAGNIYVADYGNRAIRKIAPDGLVTTVIDRSESGYAPYGLALDRNGDLLVSEVRYRPYRTRLSRLGADGVLRALDVGSGAVGRIAANEHGDIWFVRDHWFGHPISMSIVKRVAGGQLTTVYASPFVHYGGVLSDSLQELTVAVDGTLYVADAKAGRVVRITPDGVAAIVVDRSTFGEASTYPGDTDFRGVVAAPDGSLYVARSEAGLWRVTFDGDAAEEVSGLAGHAGEWGYADGWWTLARFGRTWQGSLGDLGLDVAPDGSVIVADMANGAIRRIAPDGVVTTVAGRKRYLPPPRDVAVDGEGNIYVAGAHDGLIRMFLADGSPGTVIAGGGPGVPSFQRPPDGPAEEAYFSNIRAIALGPAGSLYIVEQERIRSLSPSGWVTTVAGGGGPGYVDGPGARAQFHWLEDIAVDGDGNLYVIDRSSVAGRGGYIPVIRKVDTDGTVATLYRGEHAAYGGVLAGPAGIAVTGDGEVLLSNTGRNQIVRLTPDGTLQGVAGSGEDGYVDGPRETAALSLPGSLVVLPDGRLVVADQAGSLLRVIAAESDGSFPEIPLAGWEPVPRLEGVQVSLHARLAFTPAFLAFDGDGGLLASDPDYDSVRRISPDGTVTVVAGANGAGFRDGPGEEAQFDDPRGIAVGRDGSVYVADYGNQRIRKILPGGSVTTATLPGRLYTPRPEALAFDGDGNLLIAQLFPGELIRAPATAKAVTVLAYGLQSIHGVAVSEEGDAYLSAARHERPTIVKITRAGEVSTVFQDRREAHGGVFTLSIEGIAVAEDGTLYVVDKGYGRVVRLSPDGDATIVAERDAFSPHRNQQPDAILIAPDGSLLVSTIDAIWKITLPPE